MITVIANPNGVTVLGRLGENEYRQVQFDISSYLADYPGATFALLNQRPGDSAAYPVLNVETDGSALNWIVQSADVSVKGSGQCELVVMDGDVIAKSIIYLTQVLPALDGGGDAPSPWDSLLQQFQAMVEAAQAAQAAAEAAQEAAQQYAQEAAQYSYRVFMDGGTLTFERSANTTQNDTGEEG